MSHKVAIVTGSNKGIGYGIVRALCKRGVGVVYLTARDINRGIKAIQDLRNEDVHPKFHQLDVTDANSVKKFAEYLKSEHNGIDILINNAGVASKNFNEITFEDSKYVIDVNYKSYFNIQDYLFPILNENARVINITSDCGHITNIKNKYWINRLTSDNLEVIDIENFVDWFLKSVESNTLKLEDFLTTTLLAYRISKVAVCALTRVQQKNIGRGISINSLHPGFVKTDMTKNFGSLTVEDASEAPIYLALDCDQSIRGKYFWFDKSEKQWADTTLQVFNFENNEEADKLVNTFVKYN